MQPSFYLLVIAGFLLVAHLLFVGIAPRENSLLSWLFIFVGVVAMHAMSMGN